MRRGLLVGECRHPIVGQVSCSYFTPTSVNHTSRPDSISTASLFMPRKSGINRDMVLRGTHKVLMVKKVLLAWLLPLVLLPSGCGDGGGEGGFGGSGTIGGGEGTGAIVYVTNNGSNNVSGYTINPSTGGLAAIPGSPFVNVSAPSAIAVSSNGFFAYAANSQANNVTAFRIGTDGALLLGDSTPAAPNPASVGTSPRALVISQD
jgi:hypothetical protein